MSENKVHNCLTPLDIVNNTLDAIQKALNEQIDFSINLYGTDAEYHFMKPLTNVSGWMMQEPYNEMQFECEHATLTFLQLCNIVEMFGGKAVEDEFIKELHAQIKDIVEGRLMYYQVKEIEEQQRIFNFELNRAIEYGEVVGK